MCLSAYSVQSVMCVSKCKKNANARVSDAEYVDGPLAIS